MSDKKSENNVEKWEKWKNGKMKNPSMEEWRGNINKEALYLSHVL